MTTSLLTEQQRKLVEDYEKVTKTLRRRFGRCWMDELPESFGPFLLAMHQLRLRKWMEDRDKKGVQHGEGEEAERHQNLQEAPTAEQGTKANSD